MSPITQYPTEILEAERLEQELRALGQSLLAAGEELPEWIFDELHAALVVQRTLDPDDQEVRP